MSRKQNKDIILQTWRTREAYISASSFQVIGRWTGTQDTIINLEYNTTGLGPRFRLRFKDTTNNDNNEVLFYMQDPKHDWRINNNNNNNETTTTAYRYKLANSWISSESTTTTKTTPTPTAVEDNNNNTDSGDDDTNSNKEGSTTNSVISHGYYFWNPNAYIDSEMIIPTGYDGFGCEYVEFPYWTMLNKRSAVIPEARIQIHDFTIGISSMSSGGYYDNPNSRRIYNPCHANGRGKCHLMDGTITCDNVLYWQYVILTLGLLTLAYILYSFAKQCFRRHGGTGDDGDFVLYERVAWRNNDEEDFEYDKEEDDDDDDDDDYAYDDDDDKEEDEDMAHKKIEMTATYYKDNNDTKMNGTTTTKLEEEFQDEPE